MGYQTDPGIDPVTGKRIGTTTGRRYTAAEQKAWDEGMKGLSKFAKNDIGKALKPGKFHMEKGKEVLFGKDADPNAGAYKALEALEPNHYSTMGESPDYQPTAAELSSMRLQNPNTLNALAGVPGRGGSALGDVNVSAEGLDAQKRGLGMLMDQARGGGPNAAGEAQYAQAQGAMQGQLGGMRGAPVVNQLQANAATVGAGDEAALRGAGMALDRQFKGMSGAADTAATMRDQAFGEVKRIAAGQQGWDKWYGSSKAAENKANWDAENARQDWNTDVNKLGADMRVEGVGKKFDNTMTLAGRLAARDQARANAVRGVQKPGTTGVVQDATTVFETVSDGKNAYNQWKQPK